MTMGLKVRGLFDDKKVKEKARARKAKSDAILENIYSLLLEKENEKKEGAGLQKKK